MQPEVVVVPDAAALAAAGAALIAGALAEAIDREGRATLALSGGSTPAPAYRRLATHDDVDWARVHVFQVDERCVRPDDPRSNFRLAREALIVPAGIPAGHVHRMRGEADPETAAGAYEQELRRLLGDATPALDAVVLGVGEDGHVASLFPGDPSLIEAARWVLHTAAPAASPVRDRLTLTLPVLNATRLALFLVSGAGKRHVVRTVLDALARPVDDATPPAARVRPVGGRLVWMLDAAAAG